MLRIYTVLVIALLLTLTPTLRVASSELANTNEIYDHAISDSSRSSSDLALDKTRKPKLILPFTQIHSGDSVLEIGAGGGYTTELLSHIVGKSGKVYADGLSPKRKSGGRLPNVIAMRRILMYELPDALTENNVQPTSLDSVVIFFALHDIYLSERIDKVAFFATLHRYLKPNGKLIILDNAADHDAGNSVNHKLHRIGRDFVVAEIEKNGFKLEAESDALRNPLDDHQKRWQKFNGLHDRFALRFVKK